MEGIAVSPGIAIGTVYDTTEAPAETPRRAIAPEEVEAEKQRLAAAVATSRKQLAKLKSRLAILPEEAQEELEPLLDAYALMLGNPGCCAGRASASPRSFFAPKRRWKTRPRPSRTPSWRRRTTTAPG